MFELVSVKIFVQGEDASIFPIPRMCHNKVPIFNSNPVTQHWAIFIKDWLNNLYSTVHTLSQNACTNQFVVKYLWLFIQYSV